MTTYQDAHPVYRRAGWLGLLPLAPDTKWPPPAGFTGWDGVDPSFADCCEFEQLPVYRSTVQSALRLPSTVVGLDVDAYGAKTGAHTRAEAGRRWGRLPTGPWSSARADGASGIFFFRVPDGAVLVGDIAFPELGVGHIEVIQRSHRYALVWPSVHPVLGTRYTWRGTPGPHIPPAVDDLPDLPARWVDGLAGAGRQGERARPEQVAAFLAGLPAGAPCQAVRAALRAAERALRAPVGSRHDDTMRAVLRLLRLGERGHPGVPGALRGLEDVFVTAVVSDGSRTAAAAHGEFARMRDGEEGIGILTADPTPDSQRGCRCPAGPPTRGQLIGMVRTVLNANGAERGRLLEWATRRLRTSADAGDLDEVYVRNVVAQLHEIARPGDCR